MKYVTSKRSDPNIRNASGQDSAAATTERQPKRAEEFGDTFLRKSHIVNQLQLTRLQGRSDLETRARDIFRARQRGVN